MVDFSKLARDVFNELFEIIKIWSSGLPASITSCLPQKGAQVELSMYAIRNGRRKMEDKHVLLPYLAQLYPHLQVSINKIDTIQILCHVFRSELYEVQNVFLSWSGEGGVGSRLARSQCLYSSMRVMSGGDFTFFGLRGGMIYEI